MREPPSYISWTEIRKGDGCFRPLPVSMMLNPALRQEEGIICLRRKLTVSYDPLPCVQTELSCQQQFPYVS